MLPHRLASEAADERRHESHGTRGTEAPCSREVTVSASISAIRSYSSGISDSGKSRFILRSRATVIGPMEG